MQLAQAHRQLMDMMNRRVADADHLAVDTLAPKELFDADAHRCLLIPFGRSDSAADHADAFGCRIGIAAGSAVAPMMLVKIER